METSQTLAKRDHILNGVETGEIFAGRYRNLDIIGRGGIGTVYRALDLLLNRVVAIKMFPRDFTTDSAFFERFKREAQIMARLSNPGIVNLYDVGEADGQIYLVMQYVEGQSLAEVMASHKPLEVEYAIAIVRQAGEALGYIHRAGLIHRDLKPSNILISPNGRVVLMDFGLAMLTNLSSLTEAGTIMGTPQYMSPEQVKGERLDFRSDIFSLGVVFYELLTGSKPFSGGSEFDNLYKIVFAQPTPLRSFNPAVSPEVEKIVLKALAKKPEERYQGVDELVTALGQTMKARPPEPKSVSSVSSSVPVPRSGKTASGAKPAAKKTVAAKWAAVLVAVTLLAFGIIFFKQTGIIFSLVTLAAAGILASVFILWRYRPKKIRRPAPITKTVPPLSTAPAKPAPPSIDPTVETLPFTESPIPHTALLQGEPRATAWLLGLNGAYRGQQFRLADHAVIGRDAPGDVILKDHSVSRRHAQIRWQNGRFYVDDLSSTNGTYVNGVAVNHHELRDRDEIRIGNFILIFIQAVGPDDLAVDAKRRLREFDSQWKALQESMSHD